LSACSAPGRQTCRLAREDFCLKNWANNGFFVLVLRRLEAGSVDVYSLRSIDTNSVFCVAPCRATPCDQIITDPNCVSRCVALRRAASRCVALRRADTEQLKTTVRGLKWFRQSGVGNFFQIKKPAPLCLSSLGINLFGTGLWFHSKVSEPKFWSRFLE
jgi:hypothetical protein